MGRVQGLQQAIGGIPPIVTLDQLEEAMKTLKQLSIAVAVLAALSAPGSAKTADEIWDQINQTVPNRPSADEFKDALPYRPGADEFKDALPHRPGADAFKDALP